MVLALMPLTVSADELTVTPVEPIVSNVTCNATTSLHVENYYNISFDLQDNNGVNTTKNITVYVWANKSEIPTNIEANRSQYIFKWNSTGQTWYGPTYGYTYVSNASSTNVNVTGVGVAKTNVNVTFKLAYIAVPTSSDTWIINVSVYDENDKTDSNVTNTSNATAFDVNRYAEMASTDLGIAFGSADPGASVGPIETIVTFTSNANASINTTGADFTNATLGTISVSQFYFNATNISENATGGIPTVLTTTAQDAYSNYSIVEDALSKGISGYTLNHVPDISYNGTIPIPCRAATYTAIWKIEVTAATPQ